MAAVPWKKCEPVEATQAAGERGEVGRGEDIGVDQLAEGIADVQAIAGRHLETPGAPDHEAIELLAFPYGFTRA